MIPHFNGVSGPYQTWSYNPFNVSKEPFKELILMKTLSTSLEGLFHLIRTDESKCSQFFDPELDCKVLVNLLFGSMVNVAHATLLNKQREN